VASDKGLLVSKCEVDSAATDTAHCIKADDTEGDFPPANVAAGAQCSSAAYKALDVFVAFKSTEIIGKKIGGVDCDVAGYPSADCDNYAKTKKPTLATCAAECMKLKRAYDADKATGANCLSFVVQRRLDDRTDWTCELRAETPISATNVVWGGDAVLPRAGQTAGERVFDTYTLGRALVLQGPLATDTTLPTIHPVASTHVAQTYVERIGTDFRLPDKGSEYTNTCWMVPTAPFSAWATCVGAGD